MAQETLVLKLAPAEQTRFKERLEGGPFEYRSVPHATLSVKGEGVVATLYSSGKLVVQGADPTVFTLRYLERGGEPASKGAGTATATRTSGGLAIPTGRPLVGSDEAGKGDYFGPLVVCALRLPDEHREGVARSGVTDSKALTDDAVRRMAPTLPKSFDHAVECLDPPEYNAMHAEVKNLNPMLAELHARAIRRIAKKGDVVLVDRFANEKLVASRVKDLKIELFQFPRAEAEPGVAAASVIARAVFLERLAALSDETAVDLRKGAGAPTDIAAREFVALHGFDGLARVAKVHFKNTAKIRGARG
jgi:ribonuclease HIII